MANVENYGWAYIHPTASQAQGRGVSNSIQFISGAVDTNGIGSNSGSANLLFNYATNTIELTGNMSSSGFVSASYFHGDGSNLINAGFPYTAGGTAVITGSLFVSAAITASNYLIQNTTEINSNGSSKFGNTNNDTHLFTGSVSFTTVGNPAAVSFNSANSQLKVTGLKVAYRSTGSTAFSASVSDYIIGVSANVSTPVLIELPDAGTAGSGSLLIIKDEAAGTRGSPNEITVSASAGDTVDSTAHVTIAGTMVSKTFYSNGNTKWFVI